MNTVSKNKFSFPHYIMTCNMFLFEREEQVEVEALYNYLCGVDDPKNTYMTFVTAKINSEKGTSFRVFPWDYATSVQDGLSQIESGALVIGAMPDYAQDKLGRLHDSGVNVSPLNTSAEQLMAM